MKARQQKLYGLIILFLALSALIIAATYNGSPQAYSQSITADFADIHAKWQNSHHQKSMLPANDDNVLGNFDNKAVTVNGKTTRFYVKDGEYFINTGDIAGTPREFKIEYVFGFYPLQQYLVKTENGKYQTFPISWDSRPTDKGGQRWFHIYGDDHIRPNDRLHWTGPLQNWNGMCADCHSTGFKRNYDVNQNQFSSQLQTVNVSCKSCHSKDDFSDFASSSDIGNWVLRDNAVTAEWSGEPRNSQEIEICASCHSLRTPITNGIDPSKPFLDQFTPTLIQAPQYYPDGQVKEEDYVWGSFLQSKMHSKGVICSDCHDPHSLELKTSGNAICSQCHLTAAFDTPNHHNHPAGSTGSQCVNCHMPETTFMQVDARNDHSFRIPRPDIAGQTKSPDACTSCHQDMNPETAANHISKWFGQESKIDIHYGEIFSAALFKKPGIEAELKTLLRNEEIPPIIRASAYEFLDQYPNPDSITYIENGLKSTEPLIRLGAIKAAQMLPPNQKEILLEPLLQDDYKAIRIAAFDQIGNVNAASPLSREYDTSTAQTMWRGEGRYNLALFHQRRGNSDLASELYLSSQQIDPYFSPSYVNLADILRSSANERMSGQIIDRGLSFMPNDPDLNFSKALHLVRDQKAQDALNHLEKAVIFAPDNSRYAYTYAVALNDMGQPLKALEVLNAAFEKNQYQQEINLLLLNLNRSQGNWNEALKYAKNLSKILPDNMAIENIIGDLQNRIGN
jgi:tetratricopeptide (TPR) repeat protein